MTKAYLQCDFEIPKLENNTEKKIKFDENGFIGEALATCRGGVLSIENRSCSPKVEDDCQVNGLKWLGESDESCSHVAQGKVLPNGKTTVVSSSNGYVKYKCANGKLQVQEKKCIDRSAQHKQEGKLTTSNINNLAFPTRFIDKEILSCDSAKIRVVMSSAYSQHSGEFTIQPDGNRIFFEVCKPSGYGNTASFDITTTGVEINHVTAICDRKDELEPNCNSDCLGDEVDKNTTIVPYICKSVGGVEKCYVNTCAEAKPDESLCKDCESGSYTFTDSNTSNNCTVSHGNILSGEEKTVDFKTSNYNGSVKFLCNSGLKSTIEGQCYKTCKARSVSWGAGCGKKIPTGNYYQNQTVSVNSSVNQGSASFQCDNGQWKLKSGSSCRLNCEGKVSWGTGVSRAGQSKKNACSARVSNVKDKQSYPSIINNTVKGAKGSTRVSCDNGKFNAYNSSCNLDCKAGSTQWGSSCRASYPALRHGQNYTLNAVNISLSAGVTGQTSLQCRDGKVDVMGGSCSKSCATYQYRSGQCRATVQGGKHGVSRVFNTPKFEGNFTCDNGRWIPRNLSCTQQNKSCGSTSVGWDGCSGALVSGNHGDKKRASSTVGNGSAEYRCDNGVWKATGSKSCDLGCSGIIKWGSGNKCSATAPRMEDGGSSKDGGGDVVTINRWVSLGEAWCGYAKDASVEIGDECDPKRSAVAVATHPEGLEVIHCRSSSKKALVSASCEDIGLNRPSPKLKSTSGNVGETHYTCSKGNFTAIESSCVVRAPLACAADYLGWGRSFSCSSYISGGVEGERKNLTHTNGGNKSGNSVFTCENGVWKFIGGFCTRDRFRDL
ncbi:MAG: hypothetical protein HAW67_02320 [Endozoicomonadaceae bacterium]|nr:hypothetical protein [Endozoicomonadaceae bacterium]